VESLFVELMKGNVDQVEYFENQIVSSKGEERVIAWHNTLLRDEENQITGTLSSGQDITDNKVLRGLLPICVYCKKIRNDKGYYMQLENYISRHSDARFSHGMCPDCMREHHPQVADTAAPPTCESARHRRILNSNGI